MATIPVRSLPDSVLRQKAKRIRAFDSSVRRLAEDMIETMHAVDGVGLAAPQVGVSLRLIVVGLPGEAEMVLINPEVVRRKGERLLNEACLSVPGYVGQVKRAESVTVKGVGLDGKGVRIRAVGLLAQALEHEVDHLNGVLYIDHVDSPENLRQIDQEGGQL